MGQYFYPILVDDDGSVYRAVSHDFDNGLKLMEHSWVGNNFVNAILSKIEDHPMRLAWVGDYASTGDKILGDGFIKDQSDFDPYFEKAMEGGDGVTKIMGGSPEFLFDMEYPDCFFVNATKQTYIDLEKYVSQNKMDGAYGEYCVNPIPLLTSIGNGQGGGDYYGDAGASDVGTWAFDKVYISTIRPGTMKEVEYSFRE